MKCGLKQSNSDPGLFLNDEKSIYLIVYVDDGIIASVDEQAVKQFLEKLESEFSVVIAVANYFLGMQIEFLEDGDIFVHQEGYCRKILKHFEISKFNSVSTPVEKGTITTDHSEFLPATVPYREDIGSLMFLAIVSRPDISYAAGVLSQVLDKPQQVHWSMIKRIMHYLKGTEKCGILFQCNEDNTLQCFTDSDSPLSRRSTSGMIFMSYGGAVSWRSQRQSCIALSTTKAEFIAASQAAKEAIWLGNLLSELRCVSTIPVLQMDNQSSIRLVKNPEFHSRAKHIDIRYKFIREQYQTKQLDVVYCSSEMQAADIFTKPLVKDRFLKLRKLIGMHNFG
ncbi:Retrovirus-related Pol polyprotein from transposon TNT 1-94 [Araneus ventricosus]|uniref:Retrovirus-related Pol polyprotein from transposon TNT 1-94 n=1 Tax=Araneus ventricosus TaxID=182803 RepID=A0A4Y2QZM4_ARAVE|nr:Retrovirus-related Pol polyprotein from transposon TNT 1-94 [Araneus ventricosus]